MACKPGSVPLRAMTIHLGRPLPDASSNQPGRRPGNGLSGQAPEMPPLFGLAPGGVCRAASVTVRAVRSYRTLSPLPGPKARRFAFCGTFPGVAPAGRYPAPCFRGARTFLCPSFRKRRAAVIRPSDPMEMSLNHPCVKALARRSAGPGIGRIAGAANEYAESRKVLGRVTLKP